MPLFDNDNGGARFRQCRRRRPDGNLLLGTACAWAETAPILSEGLEREWTSRFPLSTRGRDVVDAQGARFRLRGVNWYGASDAYHVVGGLDRQPLDAICRAIKALGFTVVRLPFSNEMLKSCPAPGSIAFDKNPQLRGLSALEVLDEVVRCLGRHCVAVVLNNHTTYGEWCGGPDKNGLWFHPGSAEYTEARWFEDWTMLAARYQNCPQVVGFDLRNEVRFCPWPFRWPSWAGARLARFLGAADWAEAAVACAEGVLAKNPDLLIIVERVVWPAGGLRPYAVHPGPLLPRLDTKLVLGVHHYSWSGPGRYLAFAHAMDKGCPRRMRAVLRSSGVMSPENYGDMSDARLFEAVLGEWGCLLESETCPVWVSEFGSCPDGYDMHWFEKFAACMAKLDADWAYWPLNVGPKPDSGDGEPYGVLAADWTVKAGGDRRLDVLRAHGLL